MTKKLWVAAAAAAPAAAGLVLLRRSAALVVRPRKPELLDVAWSDGVVDLPITGETDAKGRYGIWVRGERAPLGDEPDGHLLVGPVVGSGTAATVRRQLLSVAGTGSSGRGAGRFTGQIYPGPSAVAPGRWRSVIVDGAAGGCPAWLIEPAEGVGNRWAVHVHGFGTSRVTALRSVPAADAFALTSLVISFRGDGEGPAQAGGASNLGASEWRDLSSAIDFAAGHGATDITVFAWSMGAALAFMAARRDDRISRIVAIAPVTDWNTVIQAGAARAHLPKAFGSLTAWGLNQRIIQRSLGMRVRVTTDELADVAAAVAERTRILVLHSDIDPLVPFEGSLRFAEAHPSQVTLERFHTAGHAWEVNSEPSLFFDAITRWLTPHLTAR